MPAASSVSTRDTLHDAKPFFAWRFETDFQSEPLLSAIRGLDGSSNAGSVGTSANLAYRLPGTRTFIFHGTSCQ
ncbi:pre-mRNA cleavage complex II protein [Anopheles sinensis]|uniref:Pre-mRNA cleavage complex II protein n=1 Tax=Anopheles sinensis TaxID=74873 RepID=A0A084WMA0_ANOSI|nr:pre-mRNA cleavage complex II protein [Anopheles sinensis]